MDTRLGSALEGRYLVEREIGQGGMATVYLARDLRHQRHVALKVLKPELGAVLGAERFLAEIRMTANLQHPNLLPLFDSGEADGLLFYAMPYVDGETLRSRLDREKQLPIDEAIRIASAIGAALGYAHRHDVIHRDLKPENILLQDDQPLIADFGIALALNRAGGERVTQTGLSLGTPQYMSPEQATGDRAVDGRADIYSLGAITYEMLVGDPPHVASTSHAVIAKLLTETPSRTRAIRASVPPHVDAAVACALEKLPADRFPTAKAFVDAIQGKVPVAGDAIPLSAATTSPGWRRPRLREATAWSLVTLLVALLAWMQLRSRTAPERSVVRANFDLPAGGRINDVFTGTTIALSPRGDMMAFNMSAPAGGPSGFRMYVRRFDELAARAISDAAGRNLTFSPDGRWIAFTEGNVLRKVSVEGGQPTTLATTGGAVPYGVAWGGSDTLYVGSFTGIWAIPSTGGDAVAVVARDSTQTRVGRRWPVLLPGGRAIAFVTGDSPAATPRLAIMLLRGAKVRALDLAVAVPLGMVDDQLVYVSPTGALTAVRFDLDALRPTAPPVQLEEGVLFDPTAGVKASLSASGSLAYLRGRAQFQPVAVAAGSTSADPLVREPGAYSTPRYSPDGRRMAVTVFGANATDIWIYHVARNTFTRLTTEGANIRPEWTADGRQVVFISTRAGKTGIWRQPADGSGVAELLYQPEDEPFEALVSPDMQWLIFRTAPGARNSRDIFAVPLTGSDRTPVTLVSGPYTENMPRLSPDGRWLAYMSNESGRFETYVRPFPGSGARVQVSENGGTEPVWGPGGRALYYRGMHGEIIEARVTTGDEFSIGARSVVLRGDFLTDASHANYDVGPDGRFLMLKRAGDESQTIVVHDWASELRARTRARN